MSKQINIEFQIATKARDQWIRKAATLRVKAQEAKCNARNARNASADDAVFWIKSPADYENDAALALAAAKEAERLARDWDAKAKAIAAREAAGEAAAADFGA